MPPVITALYAALLALLFLRLSIRVIRYRMEKRISLGDGEDAEMRAQVRAHANFVEYTPFALILLLILELLGTSATVLHGLGACLVLGRLAHATAFLVPDQIIWLRQLGMGLTFTMIITSAILLFVTVAF